MAHNLDTLISLVLPKPKKIYSHAGNCRIGADMRVEDRVADARAGRAVGRWQSQTSRSPRTADRATHTAGPPTLGLAVDASVVPQAGGYRLTIRPDWIDLVGTDAEACFFGLQTIFQISKLANGPIPCGAIVDWPDFATRGLLHDVTRGKVPTLATLQQLVDRLAALKVNQLQLYIEHAFVFDFDHDICDADNGLTPEEVRTLDVYCRERFIELVPALATFGHMGRILSMPRYRHLAEIEAAASWEEMSWPQRVRGLTLDCANPDAHRLMASMWGDVLAAFSSSVVNICGDEPWDLGQGKNREQFAATGKGVPYIEQILRTRAVCAARGRRVQFWSDVLRNYPDLFDRLPKDATVLHWGYDDRADYEGTDAFVASGLDTLVCSGTRGWKRILNAVDAAERNISRFAAAGKKYGAAGLLNTDWGDHGHFNPLAASWHGIALGAACGWTADHPTGGPFDRALARFLFDTEDAGGVRLLREASRVAADCETWRLLWMPLADVRDDASLPSIDDAVKTQAASKELGRWCESVHIGPMVDPQDLDELRAAARIARLFAEKVLFVRASGSRRARKAWAEELMLAARAYEAAWQQRNKPSGLKDVRNALSTSACEIRIGCGH